MRTAQLPRMPMLLRASMVSRPHARAPNRDSYVFTHAHPQRWLRFVLCVLSLALVTWYAGGLQAVDISNPANPTQLAEFRPQPLSAVAFEDPGLGGNPIEMWSYPIIKDGLIYAVDVRNGLYVLRYGGRWADQVRVIDFAEGNSNL